MRKSILLSIAACVVAFASCKKSDPAPSTNATAMFVNGCAGTTSVDVYNGNTKLANATGIGFLKSSGYQNIPAGADSITFVSNLGTPLKSGTSSLTATNHYTLFTGGLITGPTYVLLPDDLTAPTTGNAKVRFVNLSTDAMSVTTNVGTTVIASNISSQGSSSFVPVAAGSYVIKSGDPANINTVVSTTAQQFGAGKIYTIMLTGTLPGTGGSALTLTVMGNN
jgi:hypothetical protein